MKCFVYASTGPIFDWTVYPWFQTLLMYKKKGPLVVSDRKPVLLNSGVRIYKTTKIS